MLILKKDKSEKIKSRIIELYNMLVTNKMKYREVLKELKEIHNKLTESEREKIFEEVDEEISNKISKYYENVSKLEREITVLKDEIQLAKKTRSPSGIIAIKEQSKKKIENAITGLKQHIATTKSFISDVRLKIGIDLPGIKDVVNTAVKALEYGQLEIQSDNEQISFLEETAKSTLEYYEDSEYEEEETLDRDYYDEEEEEYL